MQLWQKDVNNDGNTDLILAGNEYQADVITGEYDASYGLILEGNGKGGFVPVNIAGSGFYLNGDVKSMQSISTLKNEMLIVVAINNDSLRCFKLDSTALEINKN